jgi:hypothetical protein
MMHTVSTGQAADAFDLSPYEVRRIVSGFTDPAFLHEKKITEAGVDAIARALQLDPLVLAEKKRALGFAVASPTPPPEKKADAPTANVALMVARCCPNPTWVLAYPDGAERAAAPVEVRVSNNHALRPGQWLKDCQPIGNGRYAWGGQASVIIGRRG